MWRVEAAQVLVGRYRLERKLGEGGMSVVWYARDEVLGRPVAVKVLAARLVRDEKSRRRIRAEAQAVARLSHPHITAVYDFGESVDEHGDRVPYIVMELLPGHTLAERLAEGPLRPRAAMRVCAELASALAAAHREHLVHRDVKPANVVLTPDGAKVVDFGIAAAVGQLDEYDTNAPVFGTPAYLAPERLTSGEVLAASDVYALGLLLYRLLTNALPWQVETTTQMLTAHVYVEPSPMPRIDKVPPEVADIYRRCVAKNPKDRPPASEVAAVLARAAGIQLRGVEDDPSLVTTMPPLPVVRAGAGHPKPVRSAAPVAGGVPPKRSPVSAGPAAKRPAPASTKKKKASRRPLIIAAAGVAVAALVATIFALSGTLGDSGPLAPSRAQGAGAIGSPGVPGQPGVPGSPGKDGSDGHDGANGPGQSPVAGAVPLADTTTGPAAGPTSAGSNPTPTASEPDQSGASVDRTFSTPGGVVVVRCRQSGKALILDAQPAEGYTIMREKKGPALRVGVVFKSDTSIARIQITCQNGEPVATQDAVDAPVPAG
jgi:serine/threonine-protein kinase